MSNGAKRTAFETQQAIHRETLRAELATKLENHFSVTLELGCGHGHFLSAYAAAHPEQFCVGVDLKPSRIRKAANKADRAEVSNTTFVWADARDVLAIWPERVKVAAVFVLFPDPWPKTRHTKNRILQASLLRPLALIARPDAHLYLRTDDFGNMAWVRAQAGQGSGWHEANATPWPFEVETVFQSYAARYQSLILART